MLGFLKFKPGSPFAWRRLKLYAGFQFETVDIDKRTYRIYNCHFKRGYWRTSQYVPLRDRVRLTDSELKVVTSLYPKYARRLAIKMAKQTLKDHKYARVRIIIDE